MALKERQIPLWFMPAATRLYMARTGYHAEWGVPVCAQRRYGSGTVVNSDGWQIVKNGGVAGIPPLIRRADCRWTPVVQPRSHPEAGRRTGYQYGCNRYRHNRLGAFSVVEGKADNVVLEKADAWMC